MFGRTVKRVTSLCMAAKGGLSRPSVRSLWLMSASRLECTISDDETEATVTVPGYNFGDVNRAGKPNMWKVAVSTESARWNIFTHEHRDQKSFGGMRRIWQDNLIFMLAAKYTIEPAFYDPANWYCPISVKLMLGNLGKTSYRVTEDIHSFTTGALLHQTSMIQVNVAKSTRKPAPLPQTLREKYQNTKLVNDAWQYQKPILPQNPFLYKYHVVWSDADYYYHANQASYIRICLDALAEAGMKEGLGNIRGDVGKLKVKEMQVLYLSEASPGQELDIQAWQDESTPSRAHCYVSRDDTPVLFFTVDFILS